MRRPLLLVALLAACSSSGPLQELPLGAPSGPAGVATWSAWPQAGHDARRSGSSPSYGPTTGRLRWTRHLEGNVTPGPVIAPDGTIVAASTAGVLHGLDPATGLDRWAFDAQGGYGIDLSTSPAVLPDGTVLWPGPHNTLYALDGRGQLLWKEPLRGQPSSPAVVGDRVVVGDSQGGVTAFEVRAGGHRRLWSVDVGDVSYGSVALSPTDPHRTYQSVDDRLVALDDGRVRWRARLAEVTEVSPAVGPDGTVVVGDNSPDEYGFSPAGKRLWSYRHGGQTYSSPVVTADGTAWFGDHRAYVTGVDARTGRVRGRFRGEGVEPPHGPSVGVWTSPVIDAAHNTYWGTRLGHVYGRAPSGEVLFDLSTGATVDSYPALTGDGALVVGVTDGRLLAIGP